MDKILYARKYTREIDIRPGDNYAKETRGISYALKTGEDWAVNIAAREMAILVNRGETLIPIPSSRGDTSVNFKLCKAISKHCVCIIKDVLGVSSPYESSVIRKRKGMASLGTKEHNFYLKGGSNISHSNILFVDNVATSGNTINAAIDVVGEGKGLVFAKGEDFYARGNMNEHKKNKKTLFEFLNEREEVSSGSGEQHIDRRPIIRLAKGSARIVYEITDDMVLKQAYNKKGLAQNREEYTLFQELGNSGMLAKIYKADTKKFKWIQMEKCNRISQKDYLVYFSIPFTEFQHCIKYLKQKIRPSKKFVEKPFSYDLIKDKPWFKTLIDMVMNFDIATGDLKRLSSFGQTNEGKIVLIDYGLTFSIYKKYYSKNKVKVSGENGV